MSVQFGTLSFEHRPVNPDRIEQVRSIISPYAPDAEGSYCEAGLHILYRSLHTTEQARNEKQPHVTGSGIVVTWDGRLDNREELASSLGIRIPDSTDLAIVVAAYTQWRTRCLARLVGDWALAIWDSSERELILARDFSGTRSLFYSIDQDQVTWCSVLDPIVLLAGRSFELNEEYMAGWLSSFPAADLTPYKGVHPVPPSSLVRIAAGRKTIHRYWEFDPGKRIRYAADEDYQEQFRVQFSESVRRRLRADAPVLAELSGGIDSSSIVCAADFLIEQGRSTVPRLDTVSYYDDTEPNWNERPYFAKVEAKRGRVGLHIDVGAAEPLTLEEDWEDGEFCATPISQPRRSGPAKQLRDSIIAHQYRVVLSGIGGDEVTGGVPTPYPELSDLVAQLRFVAFARALKAWALVLRKPWSHLLLETARALSPALQPRERSESSPWMHPESLKKYRHALGSAQPSRTLAARHCLPSFRQNLGTVELLSRQLSCFPSPRDPAFEKRYPFLDRDLLEFLFAIPRDQLARAGQRRFLIRRALTGIVPNEILQRKRKAYVIRAPVLNLAAMSLSGQEIMCGALGFIDSNCFAEMLDRIRLAKEVPIFGILRVFETERWLRGIARSGLLARPLPKQDFVPPCPSAERQASRPSKSST